jgi:hypothetical protein
MRINKFNLRAGWAEFKPSHPGDRQVRKCLREGMSFVIKPPILSRPPPTGFTLICALKSSESEAANRPRRSSYKTRCKKDYTRPFCKDDSKMLKAFEKTHEFFHDVLQRNVTAANPPPNEHTTFLVEKIDM